MIDVPWVVNSARNHMALVTAHRASDVTAENVFLVRSNTDRSRVRIARNIDRRRRILVIAVTTVARRNRHVNLPIQVQRSILDRMAGACGV